MTVNIGILDQSIVYPGQSAAQAFANTVKLARLAEELGFERFWVSEHHDSPQTAGSSPEVLIAHLLAKTERIKIGSGGVMLQHYSPYKVAENFNVLTALAPGRVELGIGRAPGGLPRSTQALRQGSGEQQPLADKLTELERFLRGPAEEGHPLAGLQAAPLSEAPADIYMLGTSAASAELAAERGYPYAFALFINNDPETARRAFETYRSRFDRSFGRAPKTLLALAAVAADTEEEAASLVGHLKNVRVTLASGKTVNVGTEEQAAEFARQAGETYTVEIREADIAKGTKETVRARLIELKDLYGVDGFIVTAIVGDYEAKARSFRLLRQAFAEQPV